MTIGSTYIANPTGGYFRAGREAPVSQESQWQIAVAAGGVATTDNSGSSVTNPTQVTNSTSRWVDLQNCPGTYIAFRLKYVGAVTVSPIIEVLGRYVDGAGVAGPPQRLYCQATPQITALTLTTAPTTDLTDGTSKWSEVTRSQIIDRCGCNQFLATITTAVSGGTTASDIVEFCGF